jgi:hypothetical protein
MEQGGGAVSELRRGPLLLWLLEICGIQAAEGYHGPALLPPGHFRASGPRSGKGKIAASPHCLVSWLRI